VRSLPAPKQAPPRTSEHEAWPACSPPTATPSTVTGTTTTYSRKPSAPCSKPSRTARSRSSPTARSHLTAFLPSDRAFRILAHDLTGKWYRTESQLFIGLAGLLGVNTIEAVLLYHVIPGATIDRRTAFESDGAHRTTALPGKTIKVDVLSKHYRLIKLIDADPNDANPLINPWSYNINKGNKQVATPSSCPPSKPLTQPPGVAGQPARGTAVP
jgi:hypothetical protein